MAVIRRHWMMSLTIVLVLVGGAGWLALAQFDRAKADDAPAGPSGPTAASGVEGPTASTLDVKTYCGVSELRKQLCLRDEDLAAIGCTQVQAEQVLQSLLNWYKANQASLASAREAKSDAREALRQAFAKIHMGPRDEALRATVPALKKAVADTVKGEADAVGAPIPTVAASLSAEQKAVWQTVRANAFASRPYRHAPDLTVLQADALRIAIRARARKLAVASSLAERQAAQTAFVAAEAKVLSEAQKTAIATAAARVSEDLPAMVAASRKVLPLPPQLELKRKKAAERLAELRKKSSRKGT